MRTLWCFVCEQDTTPLRSSSYRIECSDDSLCGQCYTFDISLKCSMLLVHYLKFGKYQASGWTSQLETGVDRESEEYNYLVVTVAQAVTTWIAKFTHDYTGLFESERRCANTMSRRNNVGSEQVHMSLRSTYMLKYSFYMAQYYKRRLKDPKFRTRWKSIGEATHWRLVCLAT